MADHDLDLELPYLLLARVVRKQRHRMTGLLQELGLHCGQHWIILAVHRMEGASQAALAARIDVSAASLTGTLQKLEKAGLVMRRPDPEDQRISRVFLTTAGHEIQKQIVEILLQANAETFEGMDQRELEETKYLLQHILANLERPRGEQGKVSVCPKSASE